MPLKAAFSLSGSGDGGSGTSLRAAVSRARSRPAAAMAVPLASAARSTRLTVSVTPPISCSSRRVAGEQPGRGGQVVHHRPARRLDVPVTPSSASLGSEPAPAFRAVVPGPRHGDEAQDGIERLSRSPAKRPRGRSTPGLLRNPRGPGRRRDIAQHGAAQAQLCGPVARSAGLVQGVRRSPGPWPPRLRAVLARRPAPARARPGAPPFPLPFPEGHHPASRPAPPGGPSRSPSLPPPSRPPAQAGFLNRSCLRHLPPGFLQLRPRSQVHRPRPSFRLPRQVPLKSVARVDQARRTRSSASRTYGRTRSAIPGGSPRPVPAPRKAPHAGAPVPPASSGPSGTAPPIRGA